jgi:hypothetical protein
LAGHSAKKCPPLINFVIAQALAAQHPDVVQKIKAAYKQFPRHQRSRTPRKATINQIVASLDLPTLEDMPVLEVTDTDDASNYVTSLDFTDPQLFHCKVGTALVRYKDQPWYTPTMESPAYTFEVTDIPFGPCAIFTEPSSTEHSVKSVHPHLDMLVDTGSTITMMGDNGAL